MNPFRPKAGRSSVCQQVTLCTNNQEATLRFPSVLDAVSPSARVPALVSCMWCSINRKSSENADSQSLRSRRSAVSVRAPCPWLGSSSRPFSCLPVHAAKIQLNIPSHAPVPRRKPSTAPIHHLVRIQTTRSPQPAAGDVAFLFIRGGSCSMDESITTDACPPNAASTAAR